MHRHSVDISTQAALANALGVCDALQVLAQSMNAGGGFDGPHITAGRARFSFDTSATYGYQTNCSCFVYVSKTNRSLT